MLILKEAVRERRVSDTDGNFDRSRKVSSCLVRKLTAELENKLE